MNVELISEWLAKAEEDFSTATLLYVAKKNPNNLGFHCQQCIEKMLKALLIKHGITPARTHDLVEITGYCLKKEPNLKVFIKQLMFLNPFAVVSRYPGDADANLKEARQAYVYTKEIRKFVLKILL